MAHDFSVTFSNKKTVYFFGYADGVLYDVFDARDFDKVVSGSNESKKLSSKRFTEAFKRLKTDSRATGYLDPERFPEFFKEVDAAFQDHDMERPVTLHFS